MKKKQGLIFCLLMLLAVGLLGCSGGVQQAVAPPAELPAQSGEVLPAPAPEPVPTPEPAPAPEPVPAPEPAPAPEPPAWAQVNKAPEPIDCPWCGEPMLGGFLYGGGRSGSMQWREGPWQGGMDALRFTGRKIDLGGSETGGWLKILDPDWATAFQGILAAG